MEEKRSIYKKRPKAIHIITQDFRSEYMRNLLRQIDKERITRFIQSDKYQLQNHPQQNYEIRFVVVDNGNGPVSLGKLFTAPCMIIAGYPMRGRCINTKYCQTPEQVINYFKHLNLNNNKSQFKTIRLRQSQIEQSQRVSTIRVKLITKIFEEKDNNLIQDGRVNIKNRTKMMISTAKRLLVYCASNQNDNYSKFIKSFNSQYPNIIKAQKKVDIEGFCTQFTICDNYVLLNCTHVKDILKTKCSNFQMIVWCQQEKQYFAMSQMQRVVCVSSREQELLKFIEELGLSGIRKLVKTKKKSRNKKKRLPWASGDVSISVTTSGYDLSQKTSDKKLENSFLIGQSLYGQFNLGTKTDWIKFDSYQSCEPKKDVLLTKRGSECGNVTQVMPNLDMVKHHRLSALENCSQEKCPESEYWWTKVGDRADKNTNQKRLNEQEQLGRDSINKKDKTCKLKSIKEVQKIDRIVCFKTDNRNERRINQSNGFVPQLCQAGENKSIVEGSGKPSWPQFKGQATSNSLSSKGSLEKLRVYRAVSKRSSQQKHTRQVAQSGSQNIQSRNSRIKSSYLLSNYPLTQQSTTNAGSSIQNLTKQFTAENTLQSNQFCKFDLSEQYKQNHHIQQQRYSPVNLPRLFGQQLLKLKRNFSQPPAKPKLQLHSRFQNSNLSLKREILQSQKYSPNLATFDGKRMFRKPLIQIEYVNVSKTNPREQDYQIQSQERKIGTQSPSSIEREAKVEEAYPRKKETKSNQSEAKYQNRKRCPVLFLLDEQQTDTVMSQVMKIFEKGNRIKTHNSKDQLQNHLKDSWRAEITYLFTGYSIDLGLYDNKIYQIEISSDLNIITFESRRHIRLSDIRYLKQISNLMKTSSQPYYDKNQPQMCKVQLSPEAP